MSQRNIPLLLSVAILTMVGTAVAAFVHAQSGTTVAKTFAGSAIFQYGDAGGSAETSVIIKQKVIHLRNTGSHPDTFRTTLPVNPETRCGLRGPNSASPENVLPNTLPVTLDMALAVNETQYIVAMCVTKGLPTGPFTWSYKTVSVGSLEVGSENVIAEVQDTVQITEPIPCSDADGGMNKDVRGIATGTYSGARPGYIAIYGQEPNPSTPKTTTDKFSTYIDYCATSTQLNEGFCGTDGRLSAIGISCANGCKDGVCVALPASSSSVAVSSSAQSSIAGDARCSITLRPSSAGNAMYMSPAEHIAFTVNCSPPATTATTSIVKPDGSIMALPSASNFYAWTWGVRSADVPAGVNLIRVCINDVTCQGWSVHLVVFTIIGSSAPQSSSSSNASATATGATVGNQTTPSISPTIPTPSVTAPSVPSVTPSFPTAPPARSGATLPQQVPTPITHPAPSPMLPRVQTGSFATQKKVSKARVRALKKQQQALRRELRSLERSLLRKKNVTALGQVADLRDALYDLDLRDPSVADTLRSLREEIVDLRNAVTKKVKRGG